MVQMSCSLLCLYAVAAGVKDRAELASTEYIALTSVLEGVVILRKNPDAAAAAAAAAEADAR